MLPKQEHTRLSEAINMQIAPNFIPLVRINAPEIFSDHHFQKWLNTVTTHGRPDCPARRTATWHCPGEEPSEDSDIFMLVNAPDGSDDDMPEHCWELIRQAVDLVLDWPRQECIVWLTNMDFEFPSEHGWLTVPVSS